MARKQHKLQSKVEYLMDEYKDTKDTQFLVALYKLIENGDVKITVIKSKTELTFYTSSLCDNKCCKCGMKYLKGDPCFYMNKEGWHPECATEVDKTNSYYIGWAKKHGKSEAPISNVVSIKDEENKYDNEEETSSYRM